MGISDVSIGNNFTMGELIAHQIKSARKAAGLTQEELAEKVGLATITIRQYEAGKRVPNNNAWRKIANALDVSESYILGIDKSDQALGKRLTIVRKEFNSNKGTRLSCKIDSGLYDTLAIFADQNKRTLEDEVEDRLYWSVENDIEDYENQKNAEEAVSTEDPN